jgi:long-subunit acyl-CoA synthetase (AMP-forming)
MPGADVATALGLPLHCYEHLVDQIAQSNSAAGFTWPRFDENTPAGLCYTSGTTGNPKVDKNSCYDTFTSC